MVSPKNIPEIHTRKAKIARIIKAHFMLSSVDLRNAEKPRVHNFFTARHFIDRHVVWAGMQSQQRRGRDELKYASFPLNVTACQSIFLGKQQLQYCAKVIGTS
jgi:hypothetical protein